MYSLTRQRVDHVLSEGLSVSSITTEVGFMVETVYGVDKLAAYNQVRAAHGNILDRGRSWTWSILEYIGMYHRMIFRISHS